MNPLAIVACAYIYKGKFAIMQKKTKLLFFMAALRGSVSKNKYFNCCKRIFMEIRYVPVTASLPATLLLKEAWWLWRHPSGSGWSIHTALVCARTPQCILREVRVHPPGRCHSSPKKSSVRNPNQCTDTNQVIASLALTKLTLIENVVP